MSLIVLDRDGVINSEPAGGVTSADAWEPLPGSIEAIAALSQAGYQLVIATNQPGLARGWFDLDELEAMHAKLRALVEDAGGEVAAIFYCPHDDDDGCRCRKPATGMLDAIEAEFNTSLHDCYFVGDRTRDLHAAVAKGCKPVLVRTGCGEDTLQQLLTHPDAELAQTEVFTDLDNFSQYVLR
ncbi:D-glycero-beta-D-manno-heptose-1,7-bisphosphate 7-phosphatase [Microbulbifer flavimaris]|uniref:D,D-heptose 1,7-bisphosphate phosphatase n=1 Tax=Microbulbifer flavimaris TaxID=1781068 RepID=A0ABX4HZP2_9GAMM|nr:MULTISPECIES: D-glycero-beta-D-manno-heptose 1,7-bisphosphate 7-phosphatase [Microbulbifer]KUJ83087.1 histidinol-phosphatase [Microbulbifer sp. ZGT114]PCO05273.1 D-glycero-beta-D-manno-heptose-1,7-bisphosphate 7-phosphatase [Microbulbifer flavimaris]